MKSRCYNCSNLEECFNVIDFGWLCESCRKVMIGKFPEIDDSPIPRPSSIMIFGNMNLACFDDKGNQVPALQVSPIKLWAQYAESQGWDLDDVVFEVQGHGKWRLFKNEDDEFNWEQA